MRAAMQAMRAAATEDGPVQQAPIFDGKAVAFQSCLMPRVELAAKLREPITPACRCGIRNRDTIRSDGRAGEHAASDSGIFHLLLARVL